MLIRRPPLVLLTGARMPTGGPSNGRRQSSLSDVLHSGNG